MADEVKLVSVDSYVKKLITDDPGFAEELRKEQIKLDYAVAIMQLRESLGLTQEQFAKKVNKPQSTIARIENGNANPTIKTLDEIGHAVGKKLSISFE